MPVRITLGAEHVTGSGRYENTFFRYKYDRNRLLVDWVGSGKRVLELGCSTGYISRHLKGHGCYVIGVEVDEEAAQSASAFCDKVMTADLNKRSWVANISERFEVIVMGDVLEHLVEPDEVLREVAVLLNPNGYLVISLPNVVHWHQRLRTLFGHFDYESAGTLDFTHLRFFTLATARALIECAGYRITKFHPVFGGRFAGHFRPIWQLLANFLPGMFSYQFLFRAEPIAKNPVDVEAGSR